MCFPRLPLHLVVGDEVLVLEREFWRKRHVPVLHRPLPALSDHSHLVLDGDRLWVLRRSGVVLYPPRLPVIPLAIGDVASIRFPPKKGVR